MQPGLERLLRRLTAGRGAEQRAPVRRQRLQIERLRALPASAVSRAVLPEPVGPSSSTSRCVTG
jgi:hypothetical protein